MCPVEQELAKNKRVREQVENVRERQGYRANLKNDLLIAYFDIILEHHEAIGVLIEKNLVGSGFALVRPTTETFYRALWVNACATQAQLTQMREDDKFEFPKDMMEKIDAAYLTQGFFQGVKRA